jgi:hypothetical protein
MSPAYNSVILSRADGEESLTISAFWELQNGQRCFSRGCGINITTEKGALGRFA